MVFFPLCFWIRVMCLIICTSTYSQGQNSPVFSHKQNHLVQMQSKDMGPRFGKKGKVNADEVQQFALLNKIWSVFEVNLPTKVTGLKWMQYYSSLTQLWFIHLDKFEASTIFHVEQKPSTETTNAVSSRGFIRTGNYFPSRQIYWIQLVILKEFSVFSLHLCLDSTARPEKYSSSNSRKTCQVQ